MIVNFEVKAKTKQLAEMHAHMVAKMLGVSYEVTDTQNSYDRVQLTLEVDDDMVKEGYVAGD